MGKATFVQEGDAININGGTAGYASGDVVVFGGTAGFAGIAKLDIAAGELGAVAVKGVYDVAKGTGAITAGAKAYWDATNKVATTTASGNTYLGFVTEAAESADTTVRVLLK